MRNVPSTCCFLVGLSVLVSCSSTSQVRENFQQIDTIALAPMTFERVPASLHGTAGQIEDVIVAELERAGFDVVPSSEHGNDDLSARSETGEEARPRSFDINDEEASPGLEQTGTTAADQQGADAVLYPTIEFAQVNFKEGVARWDGVSQQIEETIAPDCGWCMRVLHMYEGKIPASSLRLEIVDPGDQVIYTGAGGIEVLLRYVHEGAASAESEPIPEDELFKNEERIDEAVRIALKPIAERG